MTAYELREVYEDFGCPPPRSDEQYYERFEKALQDFIERMNEDSLSRL